MKKRWRLILLAVVGGILCLCTVFTVLFPTVVIGLFDGYDCQWMEGKTFKEIEERYGPLEFRYLDGGQMRYVGCGYYIVGDKVLLLLETDGSYFTSDSTVIRARPFVQTWLDDQFYYECKPFTPWLESPSPHG